MSTTPDDLDDESRASVASSPRDPRVFVVLLVVVAATLTAGRASAQDAPPLRLDGDGLPYLAPRKHLSDASVSDPPVGYVGSAQLPRSRGVPGHGELVGGAITLSVGVVWAVVGGLIASSSTSCDPSTFFGCFDAELSAALAEVFAGIGGLVFLVGAILMAHGASREAEARFQMTAGPGDLGAGLRVVL